MHIHVEIYRDVSVIGVTPKICGSIHVSCDILSQTRRHYEMSLLISWFGSTMQGVFAVSVMLYTLKDEIVKKCNRMGIPVLHIVIWGGTSPNDNFQYNYPLNAMPTGIKRSGSRKKIVKTQQCHSTRINKMYIFPKYLL